MFAAAAVPANASAGDFFVAGWNSSSVVRYDAVTGAMIDIFVSGGQGGLSQAHSVVIGPDGHLYVSSTGNSSVMRYHGETGASLPGPFGPAGTAQFVTSGSGNLNGPTSAVFGPDGNLYVSSLNNNRVLRYDGQTGAFIDTFVPPGSGGLSATEALQFGPDGNLYVCSDGNNAVMRYDGQTGAPLPGPLGQPGTAQFVTPGSGGLNGPHTLTFGPQGNLYVDSFSNNRVKRYDGETGASMGDFVSPGNGLSLPHGIVFGPDGHLYVGSFGTNNVLRYQGGNGNFLGVFASGGVQAPTYASFRCLPGDCDCDDDVALDDFACFFGCVTGPEGKLPYGCDVFDFDNNGHIDMADFAELQLAFTGDP